MSRTWMVAGRRIPGTRPRRRRIVAFRSTTSLLMRPLTRRERIRLAITQLRHRYLAWRTERKVARAIAASMEASRRLDRDET